MEDVRDKGVSLAYVAVAVVVGMAIGQPVVAGAVASLGANALSPLAERTWRRCCRRLLSDTLVVNHDLENALVQGCRDAVEHLEKRWWSQGRGNQVKRAGGQEYDAGRAAFADLKIGLQRALDEKTVQQLLGNPRGARLIDESAQGVEAVLATHLNAALDGHDPQLVEFVERNLAASVALFFGEFLKGAGPENTRAWRAFQKLLLGGLQDAVVEIQATQLEILIGVEAAVAKLTAWESRLDRVPDGERDPTGDAALQEILLGLQQAIARTIESEHEETREILALAVNEDGARTRAEVDRLARDVRLLRDEVLFFVRRVDDRAVPVMSRPRGTRPGIWNVPHPRNPNFCGRESELGILAEVLSSRREVAAVQAVHGLGGIGKTQIAVEYAYRHGVDRDDYGIVWWVRAEQPELLAADFASLADVMGLRSSDDPGSATYAMAVREALELSGQRWLLVFDNAPRTGAVRDYLPRTGNGDVIITSRNPVWSELGHPVGVDRLGIEDGSRFLAVRSGRADPAVRDVVEELGGLPLALEQAAAFVLATSSTWQGYLELFRNLETKLLERGVPGSDYPSTVARTWELSFREIEEGYPASAELMALCAFLDPDRIPLDPIADVVAQLPQLPVPKHLPLALQSPLGRLDVTEPLFRYSLFKMSDDGGLQTHRLVQAVTRDRLDDIDRQNWTRIAALVLRLAFPHNTHDQESWPRGEMLLAHALSAARHAQSDPGVACEAAKLLNSVAIYLRIRGRFTEAEATFERAASIAEVNNCGDEATRSITSNRAAIAIDLGDFQLAGSVAEELLRGVQADDGEGPTGNALLLNSLGESLRRQGDPASARPRLEEALNLVEGSTSESGPLLAAICVNLALVYKDLGLFEDAVRLAERAVRIDEEVWNPMHFEVASDLNALGEVYEASGDRPKALAAFDRSFSIREQVLGLSHPHTLATLNNRAGNRWLAGDLEGARKDFDRLCRVLKETPGVKLRDIGTMWRNAAGFLRSEGRLADAREALEFALSSARTDGDVACINADLRTLREMDLLLRESRRKKKPSAKVSRKRR